MLLHLVPLVDARNLAFRTAGKGDAVAVLTEVQDDGAKQSVPPSQALQ